MIKILGIEYYGHFFTFNEFLSFENKCDRLHDDELESFVFWTLEWQRCYDPSIHEDYSEKYYGEWNENIPTEYIV